MTRQLLIIWMTILTLILAGCWDQRLLKEHSLILAIGYDLSKDGKIIKTVSFPKEANSNPQQNMSATDSEVVTTIGDTVKDAENQLNRVIPEKFDRSKAKVIILGQDLASNGIFSTLDSIYRDLRGPLLASVAVVDGTAEDSLKIKKHFDRLVSGFYSEIITSAGESGVLKTHNIYSISPVLLSEGKDIVLPYIQLHEESEMAIIDGLALFSMDKMTGTLSIKESEMFLILSDQTKKKEKINLKVNSDKDNRDENYVDLSIRKINRKLNISGDNENVKAKIEVTLQADIDEYPPDHLHNEKTAEILSEKIENELNKLATQTIEKMQKANNDSLGIGQRVKAYHHATWEELDWKKTYPEISIETTFKVDIIRHGILN